MYSAVPPWGSAARRFFLGCHVRAVKWFHFHRTTQTAYSAQRPESYDVWSIGVVLLELILGTPEVGYRREETEFRVSRGKEAVRRKKTLGHAVDRTNGRSAPAPITDVAALLYRPKSSPTSDSSPMLVARTTTWASRHAPRPLPTIRPARPHPSLSLYVHPFPFSLPFPFPLLCCDLGSPV